MDGRHALDGLEPDGEVVDGEEHRGGGAEEEGCAGGDAPVEDDAGRDGCGVAFNVLDQDENREEEREER